MWDGMGWDGKWVGSDGASFLPAAAQVCHYSLELPAPIGGSCCASVSCFWWEIQGWVVAQALAAASPWWLVVSHKATLRLQLPSTLLLWNFLCRCHLQVQLLSSQGANGDVQK